MEQLTLHIIKDFISAHAIVIYLFIILGVILEGEVVVLLAGIFASLGSLNIGFSLISIIIGGVSKSFIAYNLGLYFSKNHSDNRFIKKVEERIYTFLPNFDRRPFGAIFMSRFLLLGVAWFTLILSGFKRVPVKIYVKAEAMSLAIWSVFTLYLGFFFGNTALCISRDVRNFVILILLFLFLFFIVEKLIAFIMELFSLSKVNKQNIHENF